MAELEKVIKVMPLVSVKNKVQVEGEKTITASDIITFEISITYDNLPENQGPGYICSKNYPFLRKSNWYIVIVDAQTRTQVIQVERLQGKPDSNTIKWEMKQRFGRAGKFAFHCFISNDCYIGFDKEMSIEVEVVRDDPDRVTYEYTKEDHDAVKGPGLVQGMLQGEEEDDDDDDSSEDDPSNIYKRLEDAGLATAQSKKEAAAIKEVQAKQAAAQNSQLIK